MRPFFSTCLFVRVLGAVSLAAMIPAAAVAANFQVTTTLDLPDTLPGDGACETTEILATGDAGCSVRAAIEESNALPGADLVRIPAGVFPLPNGELDLSDSVDIAGAGMGSTVLEGPGASVLFDIPSIKEAADQPREIAIRDLRIQSGRIQCVPTAPFSNTPSTDLTLQRVRFADSGITVQPDFPGAPCDNILIEDSLFTGGFGISGSYDRDPRILISVYRTRFEKLRGAVFSVLGPNNGLGDIRAEFVDAEIIGNGVDACSGGPNLGAVIVLGDASSARLERVVIEDNCVGGILIVQESNGLVITNSRISNNMGSGIRITGIFGLAIISDSEITGNHSPEDGGGLASTSSGLFSRYTLTNVTISGNRARRGGGIFLNGEFADQATLVNTSIVDNTAEEGGGFWGLSEVGSLVAKNSVIANNTAATGPDCLVLSDSIASTFSGTNLIGILDGCDFDTADPALLSGTADDPLSPELGPLAFSGGFSRTHLPLPGSPLIDATDPTGPCEPTDQRGIMRLQDGNGDGVVACDIGSIEVADFDGDGLTDNIDVCPGLSDSEQIDLDGDGLGDGCDPFPSDPQNEKTACEVGLDSCSMDAMACDSSLTMCSADLGSSQGDLALCQVDEVALQQSLSNCQTGPPFVGDINWDGAVDLLDTVLAQRLLAGLPIEPPSPAVTSLKLRRADINKLVETVDNDDVYSLSAAAGSCLAIQVDLNASAKSLRYDWTPPGQGEQVAYHWENDAPFCWSRTWGWANYPEIANCGCSAEMTQLGDHKLVITPCSEAVDFLAGESCEGNGGVEGPATSVEFTIEP